MATQDSKLPVILNRSILPSNMVKNAQENDNTMSILLMGDIGVWADIGRRELYSQLQGKDVDKIDIFMSSNGGDVAEAFIMYDWLKSHKAYVTIYLFGINASSATWFSMCADKVIITEQSLYMIHRAFYSYASGNYEELIKKAELLKKYENRFVAIYQEKTGLPEDEIWALMDEETWFEPEEALALGFVDEIWESVPIDWTTTRLARDTDTWYGCDWYDSYYDQLNSDKTGVEAYQTAALNLLNEGYTPYKINKMAKDGKDTNKGGSTGIFDKLIQGLVFGNFLKSDKVEAVKDFFNKNPLNFTDVSKEALELAVKAEFEKLQVSNSAPLTIKSLKEMLNSATEEELEEIREALDLEEGEGSAAGDDAGGEGAAAAGEGEGEGEGEEGEGIDDSLKEELKNISSTLANLMGRANSGKSKNSNGQRSKTNKKDTKDESPKDVNPNKLLMANKAWENKAISAEQYKKATGQEPPKRGK